MGDPGRQDGAQIWFRRSRGKLTRAEGWGWSPVSWQGWAVVAACLLTLTLGGLLIVPNTPPRFLVFCCLILAVVVVYANVCERHSED